METMEFQRLTEGIVKETIEKQTTITEEAFFLGETTAMRLTMLMCLKDIEKNGEKIPEDIMTLVLDGIFYLDEQIKLREQVIVEKINRRFSNGRC